MQPGLDLDVERHPLRMGGQPGQIALFPDDFSLPVLHGTVQIVKSGGDFRASGIPLLAYQLCRHRQLLFHI